VRAKLAAAIKAKFAFVSLFPPRNTLESVDGARRAIADHK
jgi:hypothetical protein